jgi:hypothetical protein
VATSAAQTRPRTILEWSGAIAVFEACMEETMMKVKRSGSPGARHTETAVSTGQQVSDTSPPES